MGKKPNLDEEPDLFSAKKAGDAVILNFKENILFRTTDLNNRDTVLGYLDRVSRNNSIKVSPLLLLGNHRIHISQIFYQFPI